MSNAVRRALIVTVTVLGAARVEAQAIGDTPLPSRLAVEARAAQAEKATWTATQRKVSAALHPFVWPRADAQALDASPLAIPRQDGGALHVYVIVTATGAADRRCLESAGARIDVFDPAFRTIQAWVDPAAVPAVAALPFVRAIRPVEPARHRAGRVTSAGDAAAGADLVRAMGYDGTGVAVGVISDGIDNAPASQASGDLGSVSVPRDSRCTAGTGHEGTAILEIVHDLAPGAVGLFSGALEGQLAFVDAVRCLTAAGARVIVDDLVYFDEPYFEDGMLGAVVREAVASGVSFHSAAGNDAQSNLVDGFRPAGDGFHDFDPDSGVDTIAGFVARPSQEVFCFLQWNDPFGASSNDYDLFLVDDPSGTVLAAGVSAQTGSQDPYEQVSFVNRSSSARRVGLAVRKIAGEDRVLKLLCYPFDTALERGTASFAIFGHPGVAEAVAVGAVDVHDPGLNDVEPFSSGGPTLIYVPAFERRAKPDLVAFDGVLTTVPGFGVFYGTSAAAPHSAAVAALLLSKNPFLTPADVQRILTSTSVDIGAPGRDDLAGAGRLDALAAIRATPASCPGGCADDDPCTEDVCRADGCTHVPVRCDDALACTADACDPQRGCVFEPPSGPAGIDCVLAVAFDEPACAGVVLPRPLDKAIARASRSLARGVTTAASSDVNRRMLGRARRRYRAAGRALDRTLRRRQLPQQCGTLLTAALDEALRRLARRP